MELRTISEWEIDTRFKILDPNGFDVSDELLNKRLITKGDFLFGCMKSTLKAVPRLYERYDFTPSQLWNSIVETKQMPLEQTNNPKQK